MSDTRIAILVAEVDRERRQIDALMRELTDMGPLDDTASRTEVRAAAGILHDFYTAVERLFARIAAAVDGHMPHGSGWHQQLLERMATEIPGVRPAAIGETTRQSLMVFLRFRHLFRNLYGFELQSTRVAELASEVAALWTQVNSDVEQFEKVLRALE